MKRHQVAKAGQVILSEIWGKKGAIGFVPPEGDGALCTSHFFLFNVRRNKLDPDWLRAIFAANYLQEQLEADAKGTTGYAAVRPKTLLACEIPLPPLSEQRRIVARIEELRATIAEAQSLRMSAANETQACYSKAMLSAFDTLDSPARPLRDFFRVTTGGTPSRANPAYWGGNIKWVSSGEVAFSRIVDTREKITELGVLDSNANVYKPGTVLVAMIGQGKTRGQCAILDCAAATNQNVAGIHVYETDHLPEYVYWWFFANYQRSRAKEVGTAQPALSGERVKQMTIPMPQRAEQHRVVSYLYSLQTSVDALRRLQTETEAELDAMLPAILDRAFKGEL